MKDKKRYAVTIDLYIYAENDESAKAQAQDVCDNLRDRADNDASIVSLHEKQYATITPAREVKI